MSSPNNQDFFKFFLPENSTDRMKIPPAFWEHMTGKKSGTVYLRGPSKKYWPVKLLEEDRNWYFARGWPEFVKDHGIKVGYFLYFKFAEDSTLNVKIFNHSLCQDKDAMRADPSRGDGSNPHLIGNELIVKVKDEAAASYRSEDEMGQTSSTFPHFRAQLKHYNMKNVFGIPTSFFKQHMPHIVGQKTSIVLQWEGKEWPATVSCRSGRQYIARGWLQFVHESGLQKGDTCKFELVDQFVIRVEILDSMRSNVISL